MSNLLNVRPTVDNDHIVCPDENGTCKVKCDGASVIISLEPVSYAMQKIVSNPRLPPHCDYIIIYTRPDPRGGVSVEVKLVEIDPCLDHDIDELNEKMKTCSDIANEIIKRLTGIDIINNKDIIKKTVITSTSVPYTIKKKLKLNPYERQGFSVEKNPDCFCPKSFPRG